VAIALNASFVARAFSGNAEQTKEIIKKAIKHKGYALVDIFQPCVSFNKLNTFEWFKNNTYYLDDSYNPSNRNEAFKKATENEPFPLGIFYINPNKRTFEENISIYNVNQKPLYEHEPDIGKLKSLIETFTIAK
jgi:2-oxoglutarate ferredoxin oxidoreductase subunit beta